MDEHFDLPIASIARIIRNALPKHYQVGKDARLAMAKATSVWILYCATVANTISASRKRKTISGDDVLAALAEIDFEDFVAPLKDMRSELTISARKKAKLSRLANAEPNEEPSHTEAADCKQELDDETEDEHLAMYQEMKHIEDEDAEPESREDVESHEDHAHSDAIDDGDDSQGVSDVDEDQDDIRNDILSSTTALQ